MPDMPTTPIDPFLPSHWSVAHLHQHLGEIPLDRIRLFPAPGTATESDLLAVHDRKEVLCELIDGVLVEKTMGYFESRIACILIQWLQNFLDQHDLGIVLGEAGTLRILPTQIRVPDVCFLRWEQFPDRKLPRESIPALAPDLAVEILSKGNTPGEMQRKLQDYFDAGVRLVWYIDPSTHSATSYTAVDQSLRVEGEGRLEGGEVLPGFQFSLAELFTKAGARS